MFIEQLNLFQEAQPLMDKYDDHFNKVAKAYGDLKDGDAYTLAILLDNTEKVLQRFKKLKGMSDTTYSEVVGPFVKQVTSIITAFYVTFDLKEVISIQPLTQKIAQIFYLAYKYANRKGYINEGDTIFSAKEAPVRSGYYSTQEVKLEPLTWTKPGSDSLSTLQYYPVSDPTEISMVIVGGAAAGTYTYLATVGSLYTLQKNGGGTNIGSINFLTGAVTLVAVDATGATSTKITYLWNSEKYSKDVPVPRITISVEEEEARAKRRQLLFEIMLDASYDYSNQYGRDLNAEVQTTIVQALQNELAYLVLDKMYTYADGNQGSTYSFDMMPGSSVSLYNHAQLFYKLLSTMSMKIFTNLGRGMGNKIIAGKDLIEYLRILPRDVWQPEGSNDIKGPAKAGKLLDQYDVFFNPAYPADEFIMTYKGSDWWEAPYYVGIYLPLMASKFMMFPDMHGEAGYIAMEAHKYLFTKHVVKGSVYETPGS